MKKHISAAFAVLALAACSKMAPENETVISELPNGDNQQETVEPKGEGIILQLPKTKVILNGDTYQFEGTEEIVVKAHSGAVTVMTNTTTDPNIFKGVFETSLGRKSETFDFYFNCANKTTAEQELVQNGQPWLECIGIKADRVADDSEANYIIDESKKIELRELKNCITLALVSTYDCTVDFHSLSAEIPATQDKKTIAGMSITANKPYFVNINTDTHGEFKGGFYLAVNKTGETGTMYTSYATATAISKNTPIIIKDFTPLSITGELSGFNTSYSIYTDSSNANRVADANRVSNDYMSGGSLTLRIAGISNSLLSRVQLKRITMGSSDGVSIGYTDSQPYWKNKTYTWSFGDATYHTTWGELTVTAIAEFKTPAGEVTAEVPALIRHITGLPYTAAPPTKSGSYPWKATRGASTNTVWNSDEVLLKAALTSSVASMPLIKSSDFYLPNNESINVAATVGYRLRASSSRATTTFAMWISGVEVYKNSTSSTKEIGSDSQPINNDKCILTSSKKYIEFESYRTNAALITDNYAKLKSVRLEYR